MLRKNNGSSILTTPIIVACGMLLVMVLVLLVVEVLMPYLWYEKLSSATIKYVYVMEEYGYLTSKESSMLKDELVAQGFDGRKISLRYTNNKVGYGEPISLEVGYKYTVRMPFMEEQVIDMVVKRESVCKR